MNKHDKGAKADMHDHAQCIKGFHDKHESAPKDWRGTHNMTGSYELDAMIERTRNSDMRTKLRDAVSGDEAYGPITGYSDYHGYRGDN